MTSIAQAVEQRKLQFGKLTFGDCIHVAQDCRTAVSEVVLEEAASVDGMDKGAVQDQILNSFHHNLKAAEIGTTTGKSFLFHEVGRELMDEETPQLTGNTLLDRILTYTLGAQVGNHSIGLNPCAGTGDSCVYTGFVKAMMEHGIDDRVIARAAAVMLKLGTIFRVGKTSTGCNMEGFGAAAAAAAAAFVEMHRGTPEQMDRAVVLALSPTIAVPCTPRVMVPGLCATHIGGSVLIGKLASGLALYTSIPVNVPADVMIAMAAAVHPVSAKHVVPVVVEYMEPFFRSNEQVERFVADAVKQMESERVEQTVLKAYREAQVLADQARSVLDPFGPVVVGGSSQAVGSPTNTARIAHYLAKGEIAKVTIELYPELFARRGINVPGIVMAAVYGAATDDGKLYHQVMERILSEGVQLEILQVDQPQMQRITVHASEGDSVVEALNRGGGRLALQRAEPSVEQAVAVAEELGIDLCD